MREYKSDPGRLARLFKAGRDKWRDKAAEKQKKARKLENRVRDLERSRAKWKARAPAAERALAQHKQATSAVQEREEEAEPESKALVPSRPAGPCLERAWRHAFPLWRVSFALPQVLVVLASFRGASRRLAGLTELGWAGRGPSAASVRHWVRRIGWYELQRPRLRGEDWVVIVDLSMALGAAKVLLIVAVPRSRLPAPRGSCVQAAGQAPSAALRHDEVQVVDLAVLEHSNGEIIQQRLEGVRERIGELSQIVADAGSDVKAGIERYCQVHPGCRSTSDVTHRMARLLERELDADERFAGFLAPCHQTRQAFQPTPLSFLIPPPWRRKSRWLQLSGLVQWAQHVLHYAEQGDFSPIETGYRLDARAYHTLMEHLEPATLTYPAACRALARLSRPAYAAGGPANPSRGRRPGPPPPGAVPGHRPGPAALRRGPGLGARLPQ